MLALVALSFGHVFMVFAVDPYSLRAIITGGYDEAKSPERAQRAAVREPARAAADAARRAALRSGAARAAPSRRREAVSKLWLPRRARRRGAGHRSPRLPRGGAGGRRRRAGRARARRLQLARARRARAASCAAAERWNERVERALFRHDAMNVAPAGAHAGGRALPVLLRLRRGPGLGRGARAASGALEIGGLVRAAGAADARRADGAAAHGAAPRALLRRGLVGGRGAHRRAAERARAPRRRARPTRATSTSSRSTTTITRAGTSRARCTRRR